jgi:type VI secretion system protein
MPLTLSIRNADRLDNGSPTSLVLDRRGAMIGRAPTVDWCLPDPTLHISSRHCEIQFSGDAYVVNDVSTNGTFLAGSAARLPGPHIIKPGDVFVVGPFEIVAALDDATAAAMAARNAAPPPPSFQGWGPAGDAAPAPPANASKWGEVPTGSAISGTGSMSQSWTAPQAAPESTAPSSWGSAPTDTAAPTPVPASPAPSWGAPAASPAPPADSAWGTPAAPASHGASDWSVAPGAAPAPPSTDDIWGKIAASNVVDWARGGFGTPPAPPPQVVATPELPPAPTPGATSLPVSPAPTPAPQSATSGSLAGLLASTGVTSAQIKQDDAATLAQAGDLLRRLVAGLVVMLEARARAKSQMGAANTSLEFDGNNPLKFARTPEQAIAQLLNPPERGFMPADRAIEDAYRDLQAHQVATLKAMQGALRATLDRFSPTAIRARADTKGVLAKILPGARDAALWQAYEREFGGVAQGSDEAFMDVFAKEFRIAYDEAARK